MKSMTFNPIAAATGLVLGVALLGGCDRPGTPNNPRVNSQHFEIRDNDVIVHAPGKPDATVNAAGDLSIAGKPVAVSPAQRVLVKRYYTEVQGIRSAAIATGKQGVAMAGRAINEVVGGLMAGDPDRIDGRVEAEAKKVEASAAQICVRLGAIRDVQDALAADLPAFAPYATVRAEQVISCNDDKVVNRSDDVSISAGSPEGMNAADIAAAAGATAPSGTDATVHDATVRRVEAAGGDVDTAVMGDGTALMRAAAEGDLARVDELIRLGANVNKATRGDGNALIVAAKHGHLDIVERLVTAGARIDAVVPGDETPLINAARAGHLAVVTYLVEHGADVNQGVFADYGRWRSPLNQTTDPGVRKYLQGKGARAGRDA